MDHYVMLTVKNQEGNKLFFKVKGDQKLKKLLLAYCKKQILPYGAVQFLINGERFDHNLTPIQAELKDGDEIDAMVHASGG
ncbi:small ubiquitin-related modifier 2-like [Mangifera indica]|uniref:small ubiquitin-related modifier 2-like n=1 Tax=Mangifera indica TaxID=29780 RepID=UPI001CFA4035|nr:small ubiquitin-related modifier 2-like [Mangifera indica]